VRASFHWSIPKKREKGLHRENNGILGSHHIDLVVGFKPSTQRFPPKDNLVGRVTWLTNLNPLFTSYTP